jgi:Spy/CpxP family protein refolding chaperone
MKKLSFLLAFVLFAAIGVNAQDSTVVKKHNHEMKQKWDAFKDLNLTADQQEKIKTISKDSKTKADAIKNNASLSEDDKKKQLKELRETTQKSIAGTLTDEQKAKWQESRKNWKPNSPKK